MRMFAQKHTARALAEEAQVPVLPGSDLLKNEEEAVARAEQIGLPVLLKATGEPPPHPTGAGLLWAAQYCALPLTPVSGL